MAPTLCVAFGADSLAPARRALSLRSAWLWLSERAEALVPLSGRDSAVAGFEFPGRRRRSGRFEARAVYGLARPAEFDWQRSSIITHDPNAAGDSTFQSGNSAKEDDAGLLDLHDAERRRSPPGK